MKKKKKLKRKLLGVGHPHFIDAPPKLNLPQEDGWPTALILLDDDFRKCTMTKSLNTCGIGAWQKVRVYLEWKE